MLAAAMTETGTAGALVESEGPPSAMTDGGAPAPMTDGSPAAMTDGGAPAAMTDSSAPAAMTDGSPAAMTDGGAPAAMTDGELPVAIAALRPLVRAVVARVLGASAAEADVEDGAHEALRRALEGWSRLRPGEPVGPWVVGIARHVALDQRRASGRRREEGGERGAAVLDAVPDVAPTLDVALDARRRAARLDAALATLPEGHRAAVLAFHVDGLAYQDIARNLGVPLGTVATWVARGRKKLAEALADEPVARRVS